MAKIQAPYVDFFLLETMASLKQAEGAILGAQSAGKPVWLSLTVDDEDGKLLRSGEPLIDAVELAKGYNIPALLVNCSVPEAVVQALDSLHAREIKIGAYANGFTKITEAFKEIGATVDALSSRGDLDPNRYANFAEQWVASGASIVGGCCEVGPAHISELSRRFKS
jgi:S-methylmethionine-dependent homocysteine/selenocysteine methylase